jgi:hypothetical protein
MVSISTIPFLFLFLPQLLKNHANQAAGNTAALAVLSWLVSLGVHCAACGQPHTVLKARATGLSLCLHAHIGLTQG